MLYLLPVLLFAVSFGDENCNSITYTDDNGKVVAVPTGNIEMQVIIYTLW